MSYQNIVNVDIALQTSALSRAGFGTPIFTAPHRYFIERVRAYGSIVEAEVDVPTGTVTHAALSAYFAQSPSVPLVKVGRVEADLTITPIDVSDGSIHSFTITVAAATLDVSYTAGAIETEEDVVDAFVSAITGDVDVNAVVTAAKVGVAAAAVLTLIPTGTEAFSVTSLISVTEAATATETGDATISAISAEDDDWYFYTSSDHSETWVLATATAIEARKKLYFFSTQEAGSLTALAAPATDIIGKVADLNYLRSVSYWHHTADASFPECAFAGYNAPFDAGSISWSNLQLNGVSAAADPTSGNKLSATQKGYLFDRNANTSENIAGLTLTREGKVSKGNFIDDIRGSDDLDVTMTTSLQRLLANQQGSKLPYTNQGITQISSVMKGDLQVFVDRGFIISYEVTTPPRNEVNPNDVAARQYIVATFSAVIAGAINTITIIGSLTV